MIAVRAAVHRVQTEPVDFVLPLRVGDLVDVLVPLSVVLESDILAAVAVPAHARAVGKELQARGAGVVARPDLHPDHGGSVIAGGVYVDVGIAAGGVERIVSVERAAAGAADCTADLILIVHDAVHIVVRAELPKKRRLVGRGNNGSGCVQGAVAVPVRHDLNVDIDVVEDRTHGDGALIAIAAVACGVFVGGVSFGVLTRVGELAVGAPADDAPVLQGVDLFGGKDHHGAARFAVDGGDAYPLAVRGLCLHTDKTQGVVGIGSRGDREAVVRPVGL